MLACKILQDVGIENAVISSLEKGRDATGIAHQYCGWMGKVDDCQIDVYAFFTHQLHVALLDGRLFLPKL